MEITKELKQDLSELESACCSFLGKYETQGEGAEQLRNKEKRSVRIPKIVSYGMLADLFYGLFLGKTNRGFLHGLRK